MLKQLTSKRRAHGRKPESRKGRTLRHESLERREVLTAIHGVVFDDLKHHGDFNPEYDPGVAGVVVTLTPEDADAGQGLSAEESRSRPRPMTTMTDANGRFEFKIDDNPGRNILSEVEEAKKPPKVQTYLISQTVPAGYTATTSTAREIRVPLQQERLVVGEQASANSNLQVEFGIASAGNIVAVQKHGNDLMLLGNSSNNHVEVHQTKNSGEFMVEGKEGTLLKVNGALVPNTTVNNVVGDVEVMLGHGDDWFKFNGAATGGQSYVKGGLTIENDWGSNMNEIHDVKVMADLVVEKVPGVWGYSQLKIVDSIVEGNTIIHNGLPMQGKATAATLASEETRCEPKDNCGVKTSGGDSKTLIENSQLKGGEVEREREFAEAELVSEIASRRNLEFGALIIRNGEGFDIVDIRDTKVGVNTRGDTVVINGDGGSRTTFTSENGLGNHFYGDLDVINGVNPVGVQAYDTVIFNHTDVHQSTTVDNMDGDSMVVVMDKTVLGSSTTFETTGKRGFNSAGKVTVLNDHGVDEFMMKDSAAPYGLIIDNAVSMNKGDDDGDDSGRRAIAEAYGHPKVIESVHMYGSRADIIDSEIGTSLKSDGGFYFWGDDKADVINVTNSWIGGRNGVMVYTYDGDDDVWLYLKGHHVSMVSIDTAEGMDHVRLEELFVTNGTEIDMGAGGLDHLELLKASQFQGNNEFEGGDGRMDRFAKDIDVIIENMEFDGFEDLDFGP